MSANATFAAPSTVEEAVAALGVPDAVALAGGTSIGLLIGQGLLHPSALVWLGRIDELRQLIHQEGELIIGAGVTLRELAADPVVQTQLPAMAEAAAAVGNSRVRAVATIGGSLAHADPRQDLTPVCLAYRAMVDVAGSAGRRVVPVENLVTGFMSTVLRPEEVITAIKVPIGHDLQSVYFRYNPGSTDDYPTVGVAATATVVDEVVVAASVAVSGAGPRAYAVPEVDLLMGHPPAKEVVAAVADAAANRAEPVNDRLGSASYKRAMVLVWVRRALTACLGATSRSLRT